MNYNNFSYCYFIVIIFYLILIKFVINFLMLSNGVFVCFVVIKLHLDVSLNIVNFSLVFKCKLQFQR